MKSLFLLLLSVAMSTNLRPAFSTFLSKYEKNYLPGEVFLRTKIFEQNMKFAREVNTQDLTYTLGDSPFADLTNEEFTTSKLCGGMIPVDLSTLPVATTESLKRQAILPLTTNLEGVSTLSSKEPTVEDAHGTWSTHPNMPPVRDQLDCAASWAFAAVGSTETRYCFRKLKTIQLSPQQVIDCDRASSGCEGGSTLKAFDYIKNHHLCTEEQYPYTGEEGDCHQDTCNTEYTIDVVRQIPMDHGGDMKWGVAGGPIASAIDASSVHFQLYTGGVFNNDNACTTNTNHAVLLSGFTPTYWVVKNSWGPAWGENGYFRIRYNATGEGLCGINKQVLIPTVMGIEYSSLLQTRHSRENNSMFTIEKNSVSISGPLPNTSLF